MTVTHSSLRPPLNPTPPHLFNAPKYVHQHVSVPIFSLLLLYSISILLSLCLMLVSNVSVSLVERLIWDVGPEQNLYVIQTHDYYTGIYLFNITDVQNSLSVVTRRA